MEEEFSDEADDGRGLSTEQVSFAKVAFVLQLSGAFHNSLVSVQVTQLMDMLCNETDVAELDIEVGHPQVMPLCCLTIQAKEDRTSDTHCACALQDSKDFLHLLPVLRMQMGSFQLHVRRRVDGAASASSQPSIGAAQNQSGTVPLHMH